MRVWKAHGAQKSKSSILQFASIFAIATVLAIPAARAYTGQELAAQAKIGIAEARMAALKAHAGKIIAEELEKEPGGSGLRYSFDIKNGTTTQEVGVDAGTGHILENAAEGPHPD